MAYILPSNSAIVFGNKPHPNHVILEKILVFVITTFMTNYNYLWALVMLTTILQLLCDYYFLHLLKWTTFYLKIIQEDPLMCH